MNGDGSGNDLRTIIEAIKSSDVVESRIELLGKLGELLISRDSDMTYLAESLTRELENLDGSDLLFDQNKVYLKILEDLNRLLYYDMLWEENFPQVERLHALEDFTCLDVSQCMLNKSILHVATKFVGLDISGCLEQFLTLGTKASIWCGKHLKMTLMSTDDSQEEEHSSHFYQLLLDILSFSADSFTALARYSIFEDKVNRVIVENFILEQLRLTKESILEIKRTHPISSDLLKAAQLVLSAAIKTCRVYSQFVDPELYDARTGENDKRGKYCKETDIVTHAINITTCTIEKLCEMGTIAANGGGNLATILNVSWKGVIILLQLCKGALAVNINVNDIILRLISLAKESLRCAAEAWSSSLEEMISVKEARTTFLLVKFYLIYAARISSQYPSQAVLIFKEIILLVLIIYTFRVSLSRESRTKFATEVLTELLEKTSMDLLNPLLNSDKLNQEIKFQILDWMFTYTSNSNCLNEEVINYMKMDAIFSVKCEAMHGARIFLVGRVALFIDFLKSSKLEKIVLLGISRKLAWLLDILLDEEVYSSILVLQVPVLYNCPGQPAELAWQPMFSQLMLALKISMVNNSSHPSWVEFEYFLLENLFHPQPVCSEIVMQLWCFMIRHAKVDLINDIFDILCSLFRLVAYPESVFLPGSALLKMAKSICILLTDAPQSLVDRVYHSVNDNNEGNKPSIMYLALLMEGFPLKLLSDNLKISASESIVSLYFAFIETFDNNSLRQYGSGVCGLPVFALSAALKSLQVSISDIDGKTLKFLVAIIQRYPSADYKTKDCCRKLLSETLAIISYTEILYKCDAMEEPILELQNLFVSSEDAQLHQCKPNLALFMASLGNMEMSENCEAKGNSAIWELYHVLLSERHWAFVHLAISAFGYFAERTCCNQLWKCVPKNATLSLDLVSGNDTDYDRFMGELKTFLEKDLALLTLTPSSKELEMLLKEGLALKQRCEIIKSTKYDNQLNKRKTLPDDDNRANKRRRLPDGINKGLELLQNGLKVISDIISEWHQNDSTTVELHEKFSAHCSSLEDLIGHLVGLAGTE